MRRKPESRKPPIWTLIVGSVVGIITLFFLMALVLLAVIGSEVPQSSRFLVVCVLAFGAALSSGFLGGYATATGKLNIPKLDSPIKVGMTGGIAVLVVILVLGSTLFLNNNSDPPARKSLLSIADIVVSEGPTFDFKLKNSGTDSAFLTEVKFVFYPGVGVNSLCLPVYATLYEFPFSARLRDQITSISEGDLIAKDSPLIDKRPPIKDDDNRMVFQHGTPDDAKRPYIISDPLKISQSVPPGGVDRFQVRFIDENDSEERGIEGCGWVELYEAYAIIRYDGGKELITPVFQLMR